MTPNHEVGLYIFILAGFLGYHIISRVPPLLHTPLMSATNAISGISLIGSLVVAGMAVAVVGTLFHEDIRPWGYAWIGTGLLIGTVVGVTMGLRIPMTAVPQRTALSHSLGALAATLVGISEYLRHLGEPVQSG